MSRPNSTTTLRDDQRRLIREIEVLQRCEGRTGLLAKPIIDQLVEDANRLLPDVIPPRFRWVRFEWPMVGMVDFTEYWRQVDHQQWRKLS